MSDPSEPSLTAEFLWRVHRAALGGRSSVTDAELPQSLNECPPGARAAHYAMAVAVADMMSDPNHTIDVPVPSGVSPDDAAAARKAVRDLYVVEEAPPRP